jgi:hypothetical protein
MLSPARRVLLDQSREVGDHRAWALNSQMSASQRGATAEVLRRQPDGSWKFIIDNPDGPALIDPG